jgi:hypothetical protein
MHYCCELTQHTTHICATIIAKLVLLQVLASPFAMGPTDNWLAEFLKWSAVRFNLL